MSRQTPDQLEPVDREAMNLARLAWDSAPAGVGSFDRLQVLLYIGGDLFLDADYCDLCQRSFDQLPAGLIYRMEAWVKHAGRFLRYGIQARKAEGLRVAA